MNSIDIVIFVIVCFFGIKGFFRGLLLEVFTLAGLLLGYVVALREMSNVASWINRALHFPQWISMAVGFFVIFMVILIFFRLLGRALRRLIKWIFMGWVDKGGGILFGVFKGAFVASLLALFVTLIPLSLEIQEEDSIFFRPVRSVAPAVFDFLKHSFPRTKNFYEEIKEGFSNTSKEITDKMLSDRIDSLKKDFDGHVKKK